jgi:serine/threonine protein kinase/ankyrin repeat protein
MSRLSLKSYARKRVVRGDNNSHKNRRAQKYLIEELNTLKTLSHRHLVRYIGSYTDEDHIAFLMAPVADCNLKNFLHNSSNFPASSVSLRYYYGCLGSAVNYLHEKGIRHRDLKPSNILIKDMRVFVTDFGTAFNTSKSKKTSILERNVPRSISYLSPEGARYEPCNMSSDMWSLGVVFLELSTVLLGKKLSTFRRHLENSVSDKKVQPFVWDRIRATYDWLDILRENNTSAEQDNEVLTWTRDLLKKQPKERLNSSQLMQRISHSPSFHSFCCFECWPDYERNNRLPKDLGSEEMTAIGAMDVNDQVTALFEQEPFDDLKLEETERHQTIEDWINSTRTEPANFRTISFNDTGSELSTEFTPNFIINQDTEEPFHDGNDEEMEEEEKTILAQPPPANDDTVMPEDNPPPSLPVPGSFPQFDYEDDRNDIATPKVSSDESNRDSISELARISTIEHNPWAQEDDTSHTGIKYISAISTKENDLDQNLDLDQNSYELLKGTQDIPSLEDFHSPTILVDAFGPNVWDDTVEWDIVPAGVFSVESNHSKQTAGIKPTMQKPYQEPTNETSVHRNLSIPSLPGQKEIESRNAAQEYTCAKKDIDVIDIISDQDVVIVPLEEKTKDPLATSASPQSLENRPKRESEAHTNLVKSEVKGDHGGRKRESSSSTRSEKRTDSSGSLPKPHDTQNAPEASTSPMKNEVDKGHDSQKRKASSSNISTEKAKSLESVLVFLSNDSDSSASDIKNSGTGIPVITDSSSARNSRSKELQDIQDVISKIKKKGTNDKEKSAKTEKLSLLNIAIHNAAQKKSDEEAKSDPKKKPYTVFSPQVYMETAWEAASTQVTQNTGKSLHNIGLRKWWDRDIRLLESMCRDGNAPAVRLLLKEGCNPGTVENPRASPLLLAVKGGTAQHYKCVQALMRSGVNLDVKDKRTGKTALQLAIEKPYFKGHTNLVRDLAAGGAKINTKDYNGEGPIHSVFRDEGSLHLEKFRLDALACLLKADINGDADVNVPTGHELSCPLHLAVRRNSPVAVGMLLYKGAEINARNSFGLTPLLMAATQWGSQLREDQETVLKLLLQSPDVQVNEKSGMRKQTALHQAVLHASPSAVKILVDFNVSTSIRNADGKTALDLATDLDGKKWTEEKKRILEILKSK